MDSSGSTQGPVASPYNHGNKLQDSIKRWKFLGYFLPVAYPEILFGGVQQIKLRTEDRGNGDLGGGSPLVGGSEDSCKLVQEISFHIVKYS